MKRVCSDRTSVASYLSEEAVLGLRFQITATTVTKGYMRRRQLGLQCDGGNVGNGSILDVDSKNSYPR